MTMLIVEVSPEVNAALNVQARVHGKTTTEYARELIEMGLPSLRYWTNSGAQKGEQLFSWRNNGYSSESPSKRCALV